MKRQVIKTATLAVIMAVFSSTAAMGQQMYTVRLDSLEEVKEFTAFVHEKLQ